MNPAENRALERCLALARQAEGFASPNPMVGCVILDVHGNSLSEGWHRAPGQPHAEVEALRPLGLRAPGATVVVNLEPCAHFGRTPPCADALIAAGVGRVVAGMVDPDPRVAGRGIERLRQAGIDVEIVEGPLADACRRLNEAFVVERTRGRPYVHVKCAISLDGFLATPGADSGQYSGGMSGSASHAEVMRLRHAHDAIMVGAGTVLADNPRLTVRGRSDPRHPWKVVIGGAGRLGPELRLWREPGPGVLWLAGRPPGRGLPGANGATAAAPVDQDAPVAPNVPMMPEPVWLPTDDQGHIPPGILLSALRERGIASVLVEGGGTLVGSLLKTPGFVDRVTLFVTPFMLGAGIPWSGRTFLGGAGMRDAKGEVLASCPRLACLEYCRMDDDMMISGVPVWPTPSAEDSP